MNGVLQFGSYQLLAVQRSEAVREPKRIINNVYWNFDEIVRTISDIFIGKRQFHSACKLPDILPVVQIYVAL